MIHYVKFIAVYFLLYGLPLFSQAEDTLAIEPTEIDRITEHVQYLASDELRGRFPGTPGIQLAADYIEQKFKATGLLPVDGKYRQGFPVTVGKKLTADNSVKFNVIIPKVGIPMDRIKPVVKKWTTGKDWIPLGFSENGKESGELVFAGYGITAEKLNYDDYGGVDVKDKVVIVIMDSPDGEDGSGDFARYSSLRYKTTNARDHGASAIVFVKYGGDSSHVLLKPGYEFLGSNSGMIALQSSRTKIAKFFPRGKSLYPLQMKINKTKQPQSYILPNVTVEISVGMENDDRPTENVFGIIKGTSPDLSDEFVVIGAHYDHLGYGGKSSTYRGKKARIHNGADDNASGVAGVLELAKRIKANPMKRSVLLMAFTGEEMGLVGSAYYADNPVIPNEKVIAMFNLDMVGRLRKNNLKIFGIGTSPLFAEIIDTFAVLDSIHISKLRDGFGPSDHSSFYKKDIPVLHFFTGVHGDYHHPNDDWDKVNYKGISHVLNYIESVARYIGDAGSRLEFSEVIVPDKKPSSGGKGYGGKIWFGIIPSFEQTELGCKISGTSPGSPARKAGLKNDDVVIEINGRLIKNLHDLTYRIYEYEPGDVLSVRVLRGRNYQIEKLIDVPLVLRK